MTLRAALTLGLLLSGPALAADVWDTPFPGVRHLHRTGPSNLNVHATVVDLCASGVSVRTTAYAERAQRTSTFAASVGAQLAINADFSCRPVDTGPNSPFPPCIGHVPYVTYGIAIHDGQAWPGTLGRDALLAFGEDRAQLYDNAEQQPFEPWMREGTGGHFSSVINGAANGYDCPIDPRTAVGLSRDQTKLIMVVADGRGIWRGMTCREAADLLVELGADRGTGLDSGGSSTMWFAGQGVVNHPSDGSERVVGNHLAIYATGAGAPSSCVQPPLRLNASAVLPPVAAFGAPGRFNAAAPVRLFDTRSPQGSTSLLDLVRDAAGRVAPASPFSVALAGAFGVPPSASSVALNLTATDAASGGYATVWPAGLARPTASTLNYSDTGAITNSALIGLGTSGRVSVSTVAPAHFIGDLQGYFAPTGAGFVPAQARRLLDTRSDAAGQLQGHVSRVIVPPGAPSPQALALNITATGPAAAGFVTLYPCELPVPATSSLNFAAGQTISSAVITRMGTSGICAEATVDVHLIVDVSGTFVGQGGLDFQAVAPVRLVDTRSQASPWVGRTTRQTPIPLRIDGLSGLPAHTGGVALNLTVTDVLDDGFATIYPCAAGVPPTSNINFRNGQTIANAALVGLGDGSLCLFSTGRAHFVIDLSGVFFAAPDAGVTAASDAGVVAASDAGVAAASDAGVTAAGDAGEPSRPAPTDGGTTAAEPAPEAPGCGCNSVDLIPLVALGLALLRRRQSHASTGVASADVPTHQHPASAVDVDHAH